MTKASDIMTKNVITCAPTDSIQVAARLMYLNGLSGLPVLDADDKVIGIITEQDLIRLEQPIHVPTMIGFLGAMIYLDNPLNGDEIEKQIATLTATKVEQVMKQKVVSVTSNADITEVAEILKKLNPVPVIDDGALVGIVSRADIVKLLAGDKDLAKTEWRSLTKTPER